MPASHGKIPVHFTAYESGLMTPQTLTKTRPIDWQTELQLALQQKQPSSLHGSPAYDAEAGAMFAPVLTASMMDTINWENQQDPVLKQFLPTAAETTQTDGLLADPVGDINATQVPGLIHKYHGRVLLVASGSCAVNCRYCFRRHFEYQKNFAPRNGWRASLEYIAEQDSIHEVILSGGDPLTLDSKSLHRLTDGLQKIPHVQTLRIHSRIPVVLPARIDPAFLQWANAWERKKVMVIHSNHAQELSASARTAIAALQQAGFTLLNQSVLLQGVNDNAEVLADLSSQLFDLGVMPYYLHQMDPVQNAAHFIVPADRALQIHQQLKARLPGYLVPKLVKEVAGEASKPGLAC